MTLALNSDSNIVLLLCQTILINYIDVFWWYCVPEFGMTLATASESELINAPSEQRVNNKSNNLEDIL